MTTWYTHPAYYVLAVMTAVKKRSQLQSKFKVVYVNIYIYGRAHITQLIEARRHAVSSDVSKAFRACSESPAFHIQCEIKGIKGDLSF